MNELIDFFIARLAEDEAMWSQAARGPRRFGKLHARRHVADCAAKRVVARTALMCQTMYDTDPSAFRSGEMFAAREAVQQLVQVYADHADFQPQWRRS